MTVRYLAHKNGGENVILWIQKNFFQIKQKTNEGSWKAWYLCAKHWKRFDSKHKQTMSLLKVLASTRKTYPLAGRLGLEQAVYSGIIEDKLLLKPRTGQYDVVSINQEQWKRFLHTTNNNRDMETAFKTIGGGIAITGVIGPGIGVGYIFGCAILGSARNPSMSNKFMTTAFIGAALCEALGLFAMMISFMAVI